MSKLFTIFYLFTQSGSKTLVLTDGRVFGNIIYTLNMRAFFFFFFNQWMLVTLIGLL